MEALYASLPSRNRELWALIRLTEAVAQAEGRSGAVCAQERGALAYQVSASAPLTASQMVHARSEAPSNDARAQHCTMRAYQLPHLAHMGWRRAYARSMHAWHQPSWAWLGNAVVWCLSVEQQCPLREPLSECGNNLMHKYVQASLARAEMAAQEAGHMGRLRADLQASAQKRAQQLRAQATRLATQIKQHVDRSVRE